MISEQQMAARMRSWAPRFERLVLIQLPAWQLLVLSAMVGTFWAASLFDWSFVVGRHPFWHFADGAVRDWQFEIVQRLVGYFYYVQSPWHVPLFYVSALGAPTGTNVIFLDIAPIVALIGKLVHSLTGAVVNLYGAYLYLCFVLPGFMMTLVLIAAQIRYALAAITAAIFANSLPALLFRWAHVSLDAHFLLIGALAFYVFSLRERAWRGLVAVWIGCLILAYLTNMYLFAMVGIVWACAMTQRRLNGLATTRQTLKVGVVTVVSVATVIALSAGFGTGGELPFSLLFGFYSMNLLSPIVPQESGLFSGLSGVIDATGGQADGFNYLGVGLLLASLLVLPAAATWLRRSLRRHIALLVAFAALAGFAISHRVFAGHWLLVELPIPVSITGVLGVYRCSGRFFYLISYALMAAVIVLGFRRARLVMALCLLGAAILQLFDVQPLRAQIIATIAAGPGAAEFDRREVAGLIARARYVEVVPSFQCIVGAEGMRGKLERANMDLMLPMARMNVPTNTVLLARQSFGLTLLDVLRTPSQAFEMKEARRDEYCNQEIDRARSGGRPGDLVVLLSEKPRQEAMASGVNCSPLSWARYCVRSKQ
jgi:Family of unknown function (DUF6311)